MVYLCLPVSVTTNKPRALFTTITNAAFYEVLREDAESHQTNWTVNRHAKPGDEVLLYVCAPVSAVVAIGVIETVPELCEDPGSEWFGSYFADIHSLVMLEVPLTRTFLCAEFPTWRYWKQPRLSCLVRPEYASRLRELLTSERVAA
jgi:hypothetical protein